MKKSEVGLKAELEAAEAFYHSIRPWLIVRPEDAVLIVPPNRVYKLAGSAQALLGWLDQGGRLARLPGLDEQRSREVLTFFEELRSISTKASGSPQVSLGRVGYDFDFSRLPILGEAALTYRCNERCRFCYAGCGSEAGCGKAGAGLPEEELTTAQWKSIIDIFKEEAKIPFFSFTGGEPLLRLDVEELAAYATSRGLRVNLITNGSLATKSRAKSLAAAGIGTAQVSLESPDEAIHDELCGSPGAWRKTTEGIRALREAGISVQTNSTLTTLNKDSLKGLPDFLASLGVQRFSMNLFIPAGRGLQDSELFIPYSEVGEIVDRVRLAAFEAKRSFLWYSPTPYCLYNPVARGLGNKSCAAMDGLLHVNPEGNVLPCSSWPESMGSLLEKPFEKLWFSQRASYFKHKEFAPESCRGCSSFVACQGACPLYWNYAGTRELDSARKAI